MSTQTFLEESQKLFGNSVSLTGHNGCILGSKQLLPALNNWHRANATQRFLPPGKEQAGRHQSVKGDGEAVPAV